MDKIEVEVRGGDHGAALQMNTTDLPFIKAVCDAVTRYEWLIISTIMDNCQISTAIESAMPQEFKEAVNSLADKTAVNCVNAYRLLSLVGGHPIDEGRMRELVEIAKSCTESLEEFAMETITDRLQAKGFDPHALTKDEAVRAMKEISNG